MPPPFFRTQPMFLGYGVNPTATSYSPTPPAAMLPTAPTAPTAPPAAVPPPYGRDEGIYRAGPPAPVGTPGLAPAAAPPAPAAQAAPSWLQQLFGGGQGAGMGMSAMLDRARMNPNLAGRI